MTKRFMESAKAFSNHQKIFEESFEVSNTSKVSHWLALIMRTLNTGLITSVFYDAS